MPGRDVKLFAPAGHHLRLSPRARKLAFRTSEPPRRRTTHLESPSRARLDFSRWRQAYTVQVFRATQSIDAAKYAYCYCEYTIHNSVSKTKWRGTRRPISFSKAPGVRDALPDNRAGDIARIFMYRRIVPVARSIFDDHTLRIEFVPELLPSPPVFVGPGPLVVLARALMVARTRLVLCTPGPSLIGKIGPVQVVFKQERRLARCQHSQSRGDSLQRAHRSRRDIAPPLKRMSRCPGAPCSL